MIKLVNIVIIACGLILPSQTGASGDRLEQSSNSMQLTGSSAVSEQQGNRLLVRFEDKLSEKEIDTIVQRLGVRIINRMSNGMLLLVEVPYQGTLMQIKAAFEATPGVSYAEPEQTYKTQNKPETANPDESTLPEPSEPSIQQQSD
jgi:hypothetical protein